MKKQLPLNTINDDFTISMRIILLGKKCILDENSLAYENVAPTISGEFNRHIRDGAGHYIALTHLWRLKNPFLGMPSFIFWSHRIFRWLAPFLLIIIYFINLFLLEYKIFIILFFLQSLFYLSAIIGFFIKNKKMFFLIYIPFYFCNLRWHCS